MDGFNFPPPPGLSEFPPTPQFWANTVIWAAAAVLIALALRSLWRERSPLGLVMLAGGALAYFNESVDDILGLVWHPRAGQDVVLNTIGPVPMWGLPTYIIFFGGVPWLLLRELRKGTFTLRGFWQGVAITFVLDLLIEIPLLYSGLYSYWADGTVPMTVARFPLYWLFINTTGPILCAAVLFAVPGYFTGWRRALVLLVPAAADAGCSIVVGLPVYSALHAPGASEAVKWGGALLSCAIGMVLLDAFARWILAVTPAREGAVARVS